tara:strand:+ start:100 stop:657 length:558 start_codon:yes stop_codon:yes gene_type:complete
MKKTKIILYGKLVKLLGQKVFYAELYNVSQVFSFLRANYPQLQDTFLKTNYCIKVGNDYVNEKNINYPLSDRTLRLVPVAEGAFLGAVFGFVAKTLIPKAVKLLAVNVAAGAASTILGAATKAAQPKTQAQKNKSISGAFNGITNTVNAGTAIPLLYGETIVGSIVVSSSVDTVQFSGKGKEKYN